jgi:hypothetical protein
MNDETLVVFTAKSIERLLREGGTSSWRLNPARARRCTYVVCTRNTRASWGDGDEPHGSAFLVARIDSVVPCEPTAENDESEENRFLIRFIEFARIDIPKAWNGQHNPVRYTTLRELDIDPADLTWEPMPPVAPQPVSRNNDGKSGIRPLTMIEAKKGLALYFSVPPEAIEITIRG